MSIATEITRIQQAKAGIKTAIEAKGVTVPSSATIDTYDDYVSQISGGGGGIQMPSNLSAATFDSNGRITSLTFTASTVGDYAYASCNALTNVTLTSGVTSIGNSAFNGCTSLTSIDIPSGVTSISNEAFESCTSLTSINIPDSVTSIDYMAFYLCSGLISCTIGSSVTSIGGYAFSECSNLTSINIPSGITEIGEYCFSYNYSLTGITVNATTPPTLGSGVFEDTNDCPIYVPSGSLTAYQTAWSDYASRIQAIPNS